MIQWTDFEKIHVIRRLRQLIGKWWRIQLNFTDANGYLRGVPKGKFFNPINEVCQAITKDSGGFRGCMGTVKEAALEAKKSEGPILSRCHSGFTTVIVPIRVEGKFLGCVLGDGFLAEETAPEQRMLLKHYLAAQFKDHKKLAAYVDNLPVLKHDEIKHLVELIEMVVDEILIIHANLSSVESQVDKLKSELGSRYSFQHMIGKSQVMQNMYSMIERVCDSSSLVLIQGENGTGKELIARALHYNSKRSKNKFITVNCGAFNENLLESELFGHVKGAFTGAIKDKIGVFEAAKDGTLFLDEIGDTSFAMQVKLLRVLQDGEYTPVGSTNTARSNARVVCATNKDLAAMVKNKEFREDLFYRLNVINLHVPPLRERKEDIPLLIEHFLKGYARASAGAKKKISEKCLERILNYNWPGNVRELENEMERLCVLAGDDLPLHEEHFSKRISDSGNSGGAVLSLAAFASGAHSLKDAVEELERTMIHEGLKRNGWNKTKLAKELGISRAGLIMKTDKYGLKKGA